MKLNSKDNINLLKECCIVREIEENINNHPVKAKKFKMLRNTIDGIPIEELENLTYEDLKASFAEKNFIQRFLNTMESYNKTTIAHQYYKRACIAAEKIMPQNKSDEYKKNLKEKFLKNHKINKLKIRHDITYIKYTVGIVSISALLALGISHHKTEKPLPEPPPYSHDQDSSDISNTFDTEDTSEIEITEPEQITSYKSQEECIYDFKKLYTTKSNQLNGSDLTPNDIMISLNEDANYVYKVKVGDEYRYVTHGDYPDLIKNYLDSNNAEYTVVEDVSYNSVYLVNKETNEPQLQTDEFGNQTKNRLDFTINKKGFNGKKLYDGNNPGDLLDPSVPQDSILASFGDLPEYLIYYSEGEYEHALKKYEDSIQNIEDNEQIEKDEDDELEY